MKKVLLLCFALSALVLSLAACGHDNNEPDPIIEPTQELTSVYANENDVHYTFDIDLDKDSSSIYCYNVVFTIGERTSPALNIRIDSPVKVSANGTTYTYQGTNIIPWMLRGSTYVPAPEFVVTDLTCVLDMTAKTFALSFNCHGGQFHDSGQLKL